MHATRFVRAFIIAGVLVTGLSIAQAGTASAGESEMIFGLEPCEQEAQDFRAFGYQAYCVHIDDDNYYVAYSNTQSPE